MTIVNGVHYTAEFLRGDAGRQAARDELRKQGEESQSQWRAARADVPGARDTYVAAFKARNPLYRNLTDEQVARIAIDGTATYDSVRR